MSPLCITLPYSPSMFPFPCSPLSCSHFHVPLPFSPSMFLFPCSPSMFTFPRSPSMLPFNVSLSWAASLSKLQIIWGWLGGCEQYIAQIISSLLVSSSYDHANLVCSQLTLASQWGVRCVYRKNWSSTFCSQRQRTWRPWYVWLCSSRLAFRLPVNVLQNKCNACVMSEQRQTCWDSLYRSLLSKYEAATARLITPPLFYFTFNMRKHLLLLLNVSSCRLMWRMLLVV